jgi:hypothetical protein
MVIQYFKNKWKEWDCDGACSVPRIFGIKKWWMVSFGDICRMHDILYSQRIWKLKVSSDFEMCSLMAARGYPYLAIFLFIVFCTLGTIYWGFKKYL